jgi:multidrug resistance efflux pump
MKSWIKKAVDIWEDLKVVIGVDTNKSLLIAWVGCLLGIVFLGYHLKMQSASFMGIADSREISVNFEQAVLVKKIHVIAGQSVHKGDLIVELEQPDLAMKMHEVRAVLEKLKAEYKAITAVAKKPATMEPLAADIKNYEQQLKILTSREKGLYVFAEATGVVGSVNFRKGETVPPYASILTVSSSSPSYVQAFIFESLHTSVKIGQKLKVISLTDTSKSTEGQIISVGSRITQMPARMERIRNLPMWGREVTIELAENNNFLLGEKVQVQPTYLSFGLPIANAETKEKAKEATRPMPMTVPEKLQMQTNFEPSGAIYLADLKKFLVVSDDTDGENAPFLFLANSDGTVDGTLLKVEGLNKIQDLESIFQDKDGFIYLLASMSVNKKESEKKSRSLLVKVERKGLSLRMVSSVDLRVILVDAFARSKDSEFSMMAALVDDKIDVESSFEKEGELYIGLKRPLNKTDDSLILNIGKLASIFEKQKLSQMKVVARIHFPGPKGEARLSEMIHFGDTLVLATTSGKPDVGRIWTYSLNSQKLNLLVEFPSFSPEGLAYDEVSKKLMIFFDEGKEQAHYTEMPLTQK